MRRISNQLKKLKKLQTEFNLKPNTFNELLFK